MTAAVICLAIMLAVAYGSLSSEISTLHSFNRALWEVVNRIGDENDRLRARVAKLERKEGDEK